MAREIQLDKGQYRLPPDCMARVLGDRLIVVSRTRSKRVARCSTCRHLGLGWAVRGQAVMSLVCKRRKKVKCMCGLRPDGVGIRQLHYAARPSDRACTMYDPNPTEL